MPKELTWSDSEDIGILLSETHPKLDPLAVRFTDLHKYVIALPGFKDTPRNRAKPSWKRSRWHGMPRFSTEPRDKVPRWCAWSEHPGRDGRGRPSLHKHP